MATKEVQELGARASVHIRDEMNAFKAHLVWEGRTNSVATNYAMALGKLMKEGPLPATADDLVLTYKSAYNHYLKWRGAPKVAASSQPPKAVAATPVPIPEHKEQERVPDEKIAMIDRTKEESWDGKGWGFELYTSDIGLQIDIAVVIAEIEKRRGYLEDGQRHKIAKVLASVLKDGAS